MTLRELQQSLERKKGQKQQLDSQIKREKENIRTLIEEVGYSEEALTIVQTVAKQTQEQLQFHISDIVSTALSAIFANPYTFKVEFVIKRNKTECELLLERNGRTVDPLSASGGGVVDITSFALRLALWTLQPTRSINTIIMDEPFKWISKDLLGHASMLLRELSHKLDIQFIIVTHLDELTEGAKRFEVSIEKGVTTVIG